MLERVPSGSSWLLHHPGASGRGQSLGAQDEHHFERLNGPPTYCSRRDDQPGIGFSNAVFKLSERSRHTQRQTVRTCCLRSIHVSAEAVGAAALTTQKQRFTVWFVPSNHESTIRVAEHLGVRSPRTLQWVVTTVFGFPGTNPPPGCKSWCDYHL